jgi:hypothetical protein
LRGPTRSNQPPQIAAETPLLVSYPAIYDFPRADPDRERVGYEVLSNTRKTFIDPPDGY